jgi:hypothetical protein
VVAVAAVLAVAIALGLALIDPEPSRTAERDARAQPAVRMGGHARPKTIVMVVFDELPLTSLMGPGERIDAGRYPTFAGLARTATWYRAATAVHDSTALAVPAMLDGRYPRPRLRSDVYSHPANLFTLLEHKYEINASEEATGLCPTSICEPLPGTASSHLGGGKVKRFRDFVSSIEPREAPVLWFKHVLLPHVPWQFYPSGRHYRRHAPEPIPGLNGPLGFGDPWVMKVAYQRHLLQLGLADRLLGELFARLRRLGLFDDALVVVVADHGIGFRVGQERRTITPKNVEDLAPVPLFVKLPGQGRGRVVDEHVETIDVLPTLLDLANVRAHGTMDGRSLLRPSAAAQAEHVTIFHRVGVQLNTIGGKYVFDPDEVAQRRRAAVRRKLALFGSGGGQGLDRLYRIGPHPELIGLAASTLPEVAGLPAARVDQAAELRNVDPTSGFVPGEITGEIPNGRTGGGRPIALALDGTIVATGRTFSLQGWTTENFEMIVPERAFRRGAMEARVFEIVTQRGAVALRPL